MKETLKRALRTFWQAFIGYVAVNIPTVFQSGNTSQEYITTALKGLLVCAIASALSALMNLPTKTDGKS